jgi:16S rRNA (guanine966-N2)-methyltransferase
VRVIAGEWRGRRLRSPVGRATRPTGEKVREATFDVLGALLMAEGEPRKATQDPERPDRPSGVFCGLEVLDLFAGAGGLGIEALSRGAARCTFVEHDAAALTALRGNLAHLGVGAARGRVVKADYRRALRTDARDGSVYTLVFVDPPYASYPQVEFELRRSLGEVLAPEALVVVETRRSQMVDLPWPERRHKLYGDTQVVVLSTDESAKREA